MHLTFFNSAGSKIGASSWSSCSAGLRSTAVSQSMSFSLHMSIENFSAALAVRLPLRVCNMKTLPSWMVNSKSCTSLKCFSRVMRILSSSLNACGMTFTSAATGSGVRTPATTSSPWALIRNSP